MVADLSQNMEHINTNQPRDWDMQSSLDPFEAQSQHLKPFC